MQATYIIRNFPETTFLVFFFFLTVEEVSFLMFSLTQYIKHEIFDDDDDDDGLI